MPTRGTAPVGSPCWVDLWTSDVDGSRTFYSELLGWDAEDADPEFGGYFNFSRDGAQIAGCMGDMGDMRATDTWKVYLATEDIAGTLDAAVAHGAQIYTPAMTVGDLGIQSVLGDPTGAAVGVWQALNFPGFTVLNENGAPSWFELHTRDYAAAVDFYRTVFHWETDTVGDTDDFRYTTMRDPGGGGELAGIMDASAFLPQDEIPYWSVYWEVDDTDGSVAKLKALGGSVVLEAEDTPYGRIATVKDPAGAQFRLRTPNS